LKKADIFARGKEMPQDAFENKIAACLAILLNHRNLRKRPLLDDKILLNWNALMVTALCKTAGALNDKKYRDLAEKNFNFLLDNLGSKNAAAFHHTYKNNTAKYPAFLDDYAYLVQACICLQELTSDSGYLSTAKRLCNYVIENFADAATDFFFFTNSSQKDVILRKKEVYDGAVPSGNSIMAENLFYLATILDKPEWQKRAEKMGGSLQAAVLRYATSFGVWASLLMRGSYGVQEIAITGEGHDRLRDGLLQQYIPGKILQCSGFQQNSFPLLEGKKFGNDALIYLCKNHACLDPVNSLEKLFLLLKKTP